MAFLRVGVPNDINEYLHEAHDHGCEYSVHLHYNIIDHGNRSPRILISNLDRLETEARNELFQFGENRLSHYCVGLNGTFGQMILLHCKNYLHAKYREIEPSRFNMIKKIVEGVPHTLVPSRRGRQNVANQANHQRFFLQCVADMIELFAAVRHNDNVLVDVPEIEYMFYQALEDGNSFFKPTPRVLRAVYELRLFYHVWEMQLDAKRLLDTEKAILDEVATSDDSAGEASENDDEMDDASNSGEEAEENASDDEVDMELEQFEADLDHEIRIDHSGSEPGSESGLEDLDIDLDDYSGLDNNDPRVLDPEE